MDIAGSYDGLYLCTIADDRSLKVFDVVNFGIFICSSSLCICSCVFISLGMFVYLISLLFVLLCTYLLKSVC